MSKVKSVKMGEDMGISLNCPVCGKPMFKSMDAKKNPGGFTPCDHVVFDETHDGFIETISPVFKKLVNKVEAESGNDNDMTIKKIKAILPGLKEARIDMGDPCIGGGTMRLFFHA